MDIPSDNGNFLPNADVLRLREYAQVISGLSDIIETLEEPNVSSASIERSYSFESISGSINDFEIPLSVTLEIGPVKRIDILLCLTTESLDPDEQQGIDYEIEPTPEVILDRVINPTNFSITAPEDRVLVESTSISIYFEGQDATYAISRSSLEDTHITPDGILKRVNQKLVDSEPEYESMVSQADFNRFILSIVAPDSQASNSVNLKPENADFLKPSSFAVLNELFQSAIFADTNYLGHQFKTSETTFLKYYQNFVSSSDQPMTSFIIRFISNDTGSTVIVRSSLDTDFKLSFETVAEESKNEDGSILRPYTPTANELHHLSTLLDTEKTNLRSGMKNATLAIDNSELAFIPEEENSMEMVENALHEELEFRTIERDLVEGEYFDMIDRLDEDPES